MPTSAGHEFYILASFVIKIQRDACQIRALDTTVETESALRVTFPVKR